MKKGFTLIELLIVIVIIGILAVAFIPSIMGAPAKARDASRTAAVNTIVEKLTYRDLQGSLTVTTGQNPQCINGTIGVSTLTNLAVSDFETGFPSTSKAVDVGLACTGAAPGGGFAIIESNTAANARLYVTTKLENATGGNSTCPIAATGKWDPTFASGSPCFTSALK